MAMTSDTEDSLDTDKEALLQLLLEEEGLADETAAPSIPVVSYEGALPLSFAQERIWFLESLAPGSPLFLFHGVLKLEGTLHVPALQRAYDVLIERHASLRTAFKMEDGAPVQRIQPFESRPLDVHDLTGLPEPDRETAAQNLLSASQAQGFDLAAPPLFRVKLIKLSDASYWLALASHHIVMDDVSFDIAFRELSAAYNAFKANAEPALAPLPVQYADYAVYQRDLLSGDVLEKLLSYWRDKLQGPLPVLELPTDFPRPAVQDFKGDRRFFSFSAEEAAALRRLAQRGGVTPFVAMLAIFKILLQRYMRQDDIIVGAPFVSRKWEETEPLVGLFLNNIVLRTDLSGNVSFLDVLGRVRDTVFGATEHQDMPFERLVQALHPERDLSRSPVFQAMFVYLNAEQTDLSIDGLTVEPAPSDVHASELDIALYIRDSANRLEGWVDYATCLFRQDTIDLLIGGLKSVLTAVREAPEAPLDSLQTMDAAVRRKVLVDWNATKSPFDKRKSIYHMFREQAERTPNAIAVTAGAETLSYAALAEEADKIAACLLSKGLVSETPVAVLMNRTPLMTAALLGVLKAGGAYVPVDPAFPIERISQMLEDSGAPFVLTESGLLERFADLEAEALVLDDPQTLAGLDGFSAYPHNIVSDHLAYIIYTSGSTGKPKGVQVEHGNVVNFLNAMLRKPGLAKEHVFLAVTTVSFDIHVLEIFLPLICGAQIVLADRDDAMDGGRLADLISTHKVTAMQATPATWRLLIESGWGGAEGFKAFCGGEGWPAGLAGDLIQRCSDVWNMYGPTETTVWSSVERITDPHAPVTVGAPIDNTQFYIVDETLQPTPPGAPGELLIGGKGVARGYFRRDALTKERFVKAPFNEAEDRLYRTGDLARYTPDGVVQIIGRLDHQVKVRGYRIELGEIEARLVENDAVKEAVTIVREDTAGDRRLVAYLIAEGTYRPSDADLKGFIRTRLPAYMTPSHIVWLDQYPMTPNRKINRNALPAPKEQVRSVSAQAPLSAMEQTIADIFKDVLNVAVVTPYDNFFDLGGHSLLSLKVIDLFEKRTGLKMQPGELFQQTVGQLAAWHEKTAAEEGAEQQGSDEKGKPGLFARVQRLFKG